MDAEALLEMNTKMQTQNKEMTAQLDECMKLLDAQTKMIDELKKDLYVAEKDVLTVFMNMISHMGTLHGSGDKYEVVNRRNAFRIGKELRDEFATWKTKYPKFETRYNQRAEKAVGIWSGYYKSVKEWIDRTYDYTEI